MSYVDPNRNVQLQVGGHGELIAWCAQGCHFNGDEGRARHRDECRPTKAERVISRNIQRAFLGEEMLAMESIELFKTDASDTEVSDAGE